MSPRLPSGALAATAAMAAATMAVCAAWPALTASAAWAAPGARAAAGAHAASGSLAMSADQVRDQEWWLAAMHVTQAWQSSQGSGITVAVLSTGVNPDHPDLTGSVITGPDYTGSGRSADGQFWGIEGTSAASVIAGHGDSTNNADGIVGIAPAAKILSLRVVLDATDPLNGNAAVTSRLPAAIAQGIRYATDHGARVIDLPLDPGNMAADGATTGGLHAAAGGSAAERAAVSYAIGKGAVLIAPAGDDGADGNAVAHPASYPGVIAFGAVDRHFARAQFSNRQSYVAATAPGVDVTAAGLGSGYRTMTTTDAASAMAAGAAALIRSRYPALTVAQVRQALVTGTTHQPAGGSAPGYGSGTLDALKAMQSASAIAAGRATSPSSKPTSAKHPAPAPRAAVKPKPATVSVVKAFLRDAAMTAGMLIVLLLVVLLLIALWRRRPGRGARAAPDPRMLLAAPTPPLAGQAGARHARQATGDQHALAVIPHPRGAAAPRYAGPSSGPYADGPYTAGVFSPPGSRPPAGLRPRGPYPPGAPYSGAQFSPGGRSWAGTGGAPSPDADYEPDPGSGPPPGTRSRAGARGRGRFRVGGARAAGNHQGGSTPRGGLHGARLRVTPASRTTMRSQVGVPGGPPWAPAPMPETAPAPEPLPRAAEQAGPPALPGPSAPALWNGPALGPPALGPPALGPPALNPPPAGKQFPLGPPITVGPSPRPVRPSTLGPPTTPMPPGRPGPPALPGPPYGTGQPPAARQPYDLAQTATPGQPYGSEQGPAPGQPYGSEQAPAPGQPYGSEQAPAPGQPYTPVQHPGPDQAPPPMEPPPAGSPLPRRGRHGLAGYSGYAGAAGSAGLVRPEGSATPTEPLDDHQAPATGDLAPPADPGGHDGTNAEADGTFDPDHADGSTSGPLYVWNPSALTDPFPAAPRHGLGEPDTPDPGDRDDLTP